MQSIRGGIVWRPCFGSLLGLSEGEECLVDVVSVVGSDEMCWDGLLGVIYTSCKLEDVCGWS